MALDNSILSGKANGKTKKVAVVNLGKKGSFKVRKGLLHKHLGIAEGTKIPTERLREALKSNNPDIVKEARSALGFRAMKH